MLDFIDTSGLFGGASGGLAPGPVRTRALRGQRSTCSMSGTTAGPVRTRALRGQEANIAGQAAEDGVLRHYRRRGWRLLARRWRGLSGEIDLVLARGDARAETALFVEVKRARSHALAAGMLRPAQVRRILSASEEFVDRVLGQPFIEREFHLVLVDGSGRIDVVTDAFLIL